jgi:glycosyltransferase involved in cell wall biosynthesis
VVTFIVPAHNEEGVIAGALEALFAAAATLGDTFEVIVVDDASTDRTSEIARDMGAKVVAVNVRQIGAARNAGARAAAGDFFIFVDADTWVNAPVVAAAVDAMRSGAVGGGAGVRLDAPVPWWVPPFMVFLVWSFARVKWAAGCFLFARRDAFETAGGFDERYFASEEIFLSRALKRRGRFVILKEQVLTSGRKLRLRSSGQILRQMLPLAFGTAVLQKRENLDLWYRGGRE